MRILIVCLGNICRSPAAEAALREALHEAGLRDEVEVDSAGTSDWHVGSQPDPRMIAAAAQDGLALTGTARQLRPEDLDAFDLVLVADRSNLAATRALAGARRQDRVRLLRSLEPGFAGPDGADADVPDPYHRGTGGLRGGRGHLSPCCGGGRGRAPRRRAPHVVGVTQVEGRYEQGGDTVAYDVDVVDVYVEIPKGSRNKYEWDHEAGRMRLDRMLFTSVQYPGDYGFVFDTWAEDEDPLDALVVLADPTFPGCSIEMRVLGAFWMSDEKGRDTKIIGVPDADPRWANVHELGDLPPHLLDEIAHFFSIYKDLEQAKVTVEGFGSRQEARDEIARDRQRFEELETRPRLP